LENARQPCLLKKASINAFTFALANELRRFNITVCAVMPGDAKTGFTAARQKSSLGADIYGNVIENSVKKMERDEQKGLAPEFLAKCIYKAACKKHPAPFYTPGLQYKFVVLLSRLLPMRVGNFILGLLYAN
jgi:short-subunit dehydrogenase